MNGYSSGPWAQQPAEDGEFGGRMVRPFTLTGGRTQPTRDVFTLITLVTTLDTAMSPLGHGLQPEHLAILRMCTRPLAVAEISAHLDLPVSVISILLSDLLDQGRISTRPPIQSTSRSPQLSLLQKVRDGLARL